MFLRFVYAYMGSVTSVASDSEILWTAAYKAPLLMAFPRQEYWSGLPCLPPGYLPDPGTEPVSPALQVDSLPLSHQGSIDFFTYLLFVSLTEI